VGACYLVQWDNLGDLKTAPSRLKCLIDSASGFDLCVSRNIVAADTREIGVEKALGARRPAVLSPDGEKRNVELASYLSDANTS
jgi:hypothetical protein